MKTKTQLIISIIILFSFQLLAQVDTPKTLQYSGQEQEYLLLNNGEQIFGKVEYKNTNSFSYANRSYFLVDSTRHEIKDIKAFQDSLGFYAKISGEDDFVKREAEGNIDLYSTTYSYGGTGGTFNTINTPHGSFTTFTPGSYGGTSKVEYFSKNGGEVLSVNYGNLREVLKDNMESMALLDDYRTLNYVKYGAGIVGIGLIVSALLDMDKDTPPNFGTMAIGGVIANIGIWIPSMVQKDKLQKSIKVYNGLR